MRNPLWEASGGVRDLTDVSAIYHSRAVPREHFWPFVAQVLPSERKNGATVDRAGLLPAPAKSTIACATKWTSRGGGGRRNRSGRRFDVAWAADRGIHWGEQRKCRSPSSIAGWQSGTRKGESKLRAIIVREDAPRALARS
jgi:hypothetical protein